MIHIRKSGVEWVEIDGIVTIKMFDGTGVQTVRCLRMQIDMNGPQSSQITSSMPIEHFRDFASPYGMVDSADPLIRQFIDRVFDVVASPRRGEQN